MQLGRQEELAQRHRSLAAIRTRQLDARVVRDQRRGRGGRMDHGASRVVEDRVILVLAAANVLGNVIGVVEELVTEYQHRDRWSRITADGRRIADLRRRRVPRRLCERAVARANLAGCCDLGQRDQRAELQPLGAGKSGSRRAR